MQTLSSGLCTVRTSTWYHLRLWTSLINCWGTLHYIPQGRWVTIVYQVRSPRKADCHGGNGACLLPPCGKSLSEAWPLSPVYVLTLTPQRWGSMADCRISRGAPPRLELTSGLHCQLRYTKESNFSAMDPSGALVPHLEPKQHTSASPRSALGRAAP